MENDYGFTFEGEDDRLDLAKVEQLILREAELTSRLHEVKLLMEPLLKNLAKNPDKEMIKWPNRKDVIDKLSKKLEDLTKV